MNRPPTDGVRVPVDELRELVYSIFVRVPVAEEHARLIADLMIDTDLRGVVSHGVMQVKRYFTDFRSAATNTHPQLRVLREAAGTAALNGDGGLGYVVGAQAMNMAIAKARETGIGAVTTTYHEHVGSCGKYVRLAMKQEMIGICSSGRNARGYSDGAMVNSSADSAPLAFGVPAGPDHPNLLCDFGSNVPFDESYFAQHPEVFFRCLGFSQLANMLSGTLGGQMLEYDADTVKYPAANQSGFFMAIAVEKFVSAEAFKEDVDKTMVNVSKMQPYPGLSKAQLPGGPEFDCERNYRRDGIPVCAAAQENLELIAAEVGVEVPW